MKKADWTWMPHAGHFILGDQCLFRLNTHVGNYIVSTVGELWHDDPAIRRIHADIHDKVWYAQNKGKIGDDFKYAYRKRFGFETLGMNRLYETMVFRSQLDSDPNNQCCPFRIRAGEDVEMEGYMTAADAYEGHMRLCKKYAKKK
jgi:hypothetical protein